MIVTRKWLEEFIDLSGISTEEIIETLNRIGQEVEGYKKIEVPQNVVIGEVVECEKHPDADKLNLTKVNVGDEELQIVCGAKNVAKGQFVAVAKIGSVLPGNFKIKKAKLRGVESFGMICAAREIGLPDFHDGIIVLDESLGTLELGKYVGELFNDEVIELGITANRGDSFSIYGIARELSAAFNRDLKDIEVENIELQEGIGRILHIKNSPNYSSHLIKAFEGQVNSNLKIDYRLALVEVEAKNELDKFIKYSTHATGVLLVASELTDVEFCEENELDVLKTAKGNYLVGVRNEIKVEAATRFFIDANYINPEYVSEKVFKYKLKTDEYFFRASRGSETNLKLGLDYFFNEIKLPQFGGVIDLINDFQPTIVNVNLNELLDIIGDKIDEKEVVEILKKLGFSVEILSDESLNAKVPLFRSDIKNLQDVAEEILRIYGIDNIKSKPLEFKEENRINEVIKNIEFLNELKVKAVANGFYETLHFVFDNRERLKKYGFEVVDEELDLANPISDELNTLRSTLLLQMFDDIKRNRANGYKRVYLFGAGSLYNSKREETQKMAFVVNGANDYENPKNSGKPSKVDFKFIVDKLANILGEFELVEGEFNIAHPYQCAKIVKNGNELGVVAKLHPKVAKDFDLDDTYFAEIDLDGLKEDKKSAKEIIKFPKVTRDLSLVLDKSLNYRDVYDIINAVEIIELVDFYPIDIFDLGDKNSLTVRFIIQADKTLTDEEINSIMDKILNMLNEKGIELR